jgi:hypothetical protein
LTAAGVVATTVAMTGRKEKTIAAPPNKENFNPKALKVIEYET